MNHNRWIALLATTALLLSSCSRTPEAVTVDAPLIPADTEGLLTYKAALFSRPIVMGYLHGWQATNGVMLALTPDSLDVAVVEAPGHTLTPAMATDLGTVQATLGTRVLLRADLHTLDASLEKALKRDLKAERRQITAEWAQTHSTEEGTTESNGTETPAETLDDRLLAAESATRAAYAERADREAKALLQATTQLVTDAHFDGLCIALPERFAVLTPEATHSILATVTSNGFGGTEAPYLSIETPFEAGRDLIEQHATWVVYRHSSADPKLSLITDEAQQWPRNRYIATTDLSSPDDPKGYDDSRVFDPSGKATPRSAELITWSAPNRAGVGYFGIQADAPFSSASKTNYTTLRQLIHRAGARH